MSGDFKSYVEITRAGVESGKISFYNRLTGEQEHLTDLDLAVTYAVGKIGERKGYPVEITPEEVYREIMKFAPELMEENTKA